MKKSNLYLLALIIAAIGLAGAIYKWKVLRFPLLASESVNVWTVQARVEFEADGSPNLAVLQLPNRSAGAIPNFAIIDENFLSRGYSQEVRKSRGGRAVEWVKRDDRGTTVLYYTAQLVRDAHTYVDSSKPRIGQPPELSEPERAALDTLFNEVRAESADIATFARAFVRKLSGPLSDEARILLAQRRSLEDRVNFIVGALSVRKIATRVIHGFVLSQSQPSALLKPYLQVHNEQEWITIDPETGIAGLPDDFLVWSTTDDPVLEVRSDSRPILELSVQTNLADAVQLAERRTSVRDERLIAYSLLALPIDKQEVYKMLLMVPIGAFVMLLLRNVVGVKTFGTFMPVLVALAFEQTSLVSALILFTVVVTLGLLVRALMEKLKLLLVPRLTAVLILVVLLMAAVSIVSHQLKIEVGLSVALFPMVIMTMTIERLSVAWDERGGGYAVRQGVGSLVVACVCYMAMSFDPLRHLLFTFPELLLVLFALTLLLGRYSGYRLNELLRFRSVSELAEKMPDPIAPPPKSPSADPSKSADDASQKPAG
jgi:hypothetical protein